VEPALIFIQAAQLRLQSHKLVRWTAAMAHQTRVQVDHAVLVRAQTRQLHQEAMRLEELRLLGEATIYAPLAALGNLIDGEICEDSTLISELNASGCACERCDEGESVSAVIRFNSMTPMLAICAQCFQELTRLSLGQVT
jgi:hypothetical protein